MSNRTIEATLRLAAKLGNMAAFSHLAKKLAEVDRKSKAFNKTQGLIAKGQRELNMVALRYAAPAVLAAGAVAATKQFAAVERRMTRIGINADASKEQMASAMERLRQVAQDTMTPVDNVVGGLESLIASGKSLDEALALLPSVARTAQAADADFREMASTADAISASFGIAASNMSGSFDIMAKSGKAGKFELKDMAAFLPSLAPAFAALGYKGTDGLKRLTAALQVVRMEVGTSGEAATSFMDVISKMETDTVSNNFKKFGLNIRKEMAKAKANGEDTLEAFIRLSREAVKGDMSKLPQLFTDKQMLIAMRALMNRTSEMRDLFKELGTAIGTVDRDLSKLGSDAQAKFDKLANSVDRIAKAAGGLVVDLGAADLADSASAAMDYQAAVTRGHRKNGRGFMAATWWNTTHGERDKDALAYVDGDYRSDPEMNARLGVGAGPATRSRRRFREMPKPTWRPAEGATPPGLATRPPIATGPQTPFPAGASPRDAERQSYQALRADPNGIADAIDMALSQGAQKVGASGQEVGEKAGAAIAAQASAIGAAIGDAAASRIRAAATAAVRAAPTDERGPGDL